MAKMEPLYMSDVVQVEVDLPDNFDEVFFPLWVRQNLTEPSIEVFQQAMLDGNNHAEALIHALRNDIIIAAIQLQIDEQKQGNENEE